MADDAMPAAPWQRQAGGVRLAVRLTPRAGRDGIAGIVATGDGRAALAIRLAAPPVDGAANAALIAFLATALGLAKRDVTIRTGHAARQKIVDLAGDADALCERLSRLT